jgi:hypothetical protein
MKFVDIPTRTYGVTDPSWWNSLQAAGARLEAFFGGGAITDTPFTVANNQSSPANVTGFLVDPTLYRSFLAEYSIYRKTTGAGATELAEKGIIQAVFSTVAGTWEMTVGPAVGSAGVTFTITNAGQVKYTSTNITGTPATSKLTFKVSTMEI